MCTCQLIFVRHGKAAAQPGEPDSARKLTELGIKQGQKRRSLLGNPAFDLVVVSHLPRTDEMACLIAGIDDPARLPYRSVVPELFTPEGQDDESKTINRAINGLYETHGNKSLSGYRNLDPVQAGQPITRFGELGWQAIRPVITRHEPDLGLILGHALCTPAILDAASGGRFPVVADTVMGEGEGFRVWVEDGEVVDIELLPLLNL